MSPETVWADLKRLINEKVVASCCLFILLNNITKLRYLLLNVTLTLNSKDTLFWIYVYINTFLCFVDGVGFGV